MVRSFTKRFDVSSSSTQGESHCLYLPTLTNGGQGILRCDVHRNDHKIFFTERPEERKLRKNQSILFLLAPATNMMQRPDSITQSSTLSNTTSIFGLLAKRILNQNTPRLYITTLFICRCILEVFLDLRIVLMPAIYQKQTSMGVHTKYDSLY